MSYTLALLPEELFLDPTDLEAQTDLPLVATGSGWTLGGVALTAAQDDLLGQGLWAWRGYFSKPPIRYAHADAGKSMDTATFTLQYQVLAPNGHRLYTLGDPYDASIDILSGYTGS